MITRIHVDQHTIKRNRTNGENMPPITVKDYRQNRKAHTAIIRAADGTEVARFVYRPGKPLSCGARLWVETTLTVDIVTDDTDDAPAEKVLPERLTATIESVRINA